MNDTFSFERMMMTGRFYARSMRIQLCIYFAIVVVFFALSVLAKSYLGSDLFVWALGTIVFSYMIYLGSLVFARYDDQLIMTQLPALNQEKALMVIGYAVIVIPVFIIAVWSLCWCVCELLPCENIDYLVFFGSSATAVPEFIDYPKYMTVCSTFSGWLMTLSIGLYVTVSARRNRVIKCILSVIITNIVSFVVGAIVGVVAVLTKLMTTDTDKLLAEIEEAGDDFVATNMDKFLDFISNVAFVSMITCTAIGIVMVYLTWRKISNRQI